MAEQSEALTASLRATRRLALLSLGAASGAAAAYVITVGTRAGQLIGELILGGRPPALEQVATAESVLEIMSRSSLALGTIVIGAIALLQRRPRLAGAALSVVIGANVTTQLLKQILLLGRTCSVVSSIRFPTAFRAGTLPLWRRSPWDYCSSSRPCFAHRSSCSRE